MAQFKRYLGDGIDFDFNGHQVILTSSTGRVYLKPQIVDSFLSTLTGLKSDLRREKKRKVDPDEFFRRAVK